MDNDQEIKDILKEILKWTKVTSIPKVKDVLIEILQTPQEKIAYQSSDGRSSSKVSKEANVSYVTVTLWWKRWIKAGIAESVSARGGQRAKRVFSLDDFGIEVPSIERPKIEEEKKAKKQVKKNG